MNILYLSIRLLIALTLGVFLVSCNSNNTENTNKSINKSNDELATDSFAFYEDALLSDSLNIDLRVDLAMNYYVKMQYEKAIEHLLKVCAIDEKNSNALITLGNIYYDTEQFDKGIEYYEKALALDNNIDVRCDLATCYLSLNKPEKACAILKKNIEMDYNHIQSHHNLSIVYKELGMMKEANDEMIIFKSLDK